MKAARHALLSTFHDLGNLVQMGVDIVRQLIEMAPLLAKFWRLVRGSQEIAILPLDVIDDAPTIEAAMQAD